MKAKKFQLYAILGAVLILAGIVFIYPRLEDRDYTVKVVEPTCMEKGYTIYTYTRDGTTKFKDITDELGHSFGEWGREPANTSEEQRICERCGFTETRKIGNKQEIPSISFYGSLEGIGKKSEVKVGFSYVDKKQSFNGFAMLKHQGHSSLEHDKKNFTVKFFNDDYCEEKKTVKFNDWNAEHKYILKANYTDASKIRNLVCTDIWREMVKCRDKAHKRLLKTSYCGAVDGFPVVVYLNDEFYGLYDLMLHKDDDLFLMEGGKKDGILISNYGSTDEALFKKNVDWEADETWEIEYCGTEKKKWLQKKFNKFSEFILKSDNKKFKKNLKKYADISSIIDYMIATYCLGISNKDYEDIVMITYDNSPWIFSMFDMGRAFGRKDGGIMALPVEEKLPRFNNSEKNYGTENLLFIRMFDCFYDEICDRYSELRKSVLSEENLINTVDLRNSQIPTDVLAAEYEKYKDSPGLDNLTVTQIKKYIAERLALTDAIFLKGEI